MSNFPNQHVASCTAHPRVQRVYSVFGNIYALNQHLPGVKYYKSTSADNSTQPASRQDSKNASEQCQVVFLEFVFEAPVQCTRLTAKCLGQSGQVSSAVCLECTAQETHTYTLIRIPPIVCHLCLYTGHLYRTPSVYHLDPLTTVYKCSLHMVPRSASPSENLSLQESCRPVSTIVRIYASVLMCFSHLSSTVQLRLSRSGWMDTHLISQCHLVEKVVLIRVSQSVNWHVRVKWLLRGKQTQSHS